MASASLEEEDTELNFGKLLVRTFSSSATPDSKRDAQCKVERLNLLNIANLCIKNLIDSALKLGKVIDESFEPFQQFFVMLESVLRHGLRMKRNILGQRKDYWGPLEALEQVAPDSSEIVKSVQNLPNIRTNHGKGRAWVRLALMQKKLAEYLMILVESKELLRDWYEPRAALMQEEGSVISGLLVGINIIDCNFDLKGDSLDTWSAVLDLSLYLKDGNYLEKSLPDNNKKGDDSEGSDLSVLIDQKTYLEEVNRNLNTTVNTLQSKVKNLKMTNDDLSTQLTSCTEQIVQLMQERDILQDANNQMNEVSARKLQLAQADIDVERETYQKSREGLNEMYNVIRKQLDTEIQLRKETEKELDLARSMREESEVAMRLLEKDIHDKQDTLVSIRRQLEDVKKLNLELHNKLQMSETSTKDHMGKWTELEEKCARLISHTKELENSLGEVTSKKTAAENLASQLNNKLADSESERTALTTNLKIEREWRTSLQEESVKDKERIGAMQMELTQLEKLKKEYQALHEKYMSLKKSYSEQEMALVEMGSHLSNSQQKVEEMKEVTQSMKDMKWAEDKDATKCQQCNQPFSLARRKHHCRNCGGIFCNSCSDYTMPLPSSAKPVRVCDSCYTTLLQRYQR
ncbi:RUN and FYVE domain-containing protein 2-like [Pocillopora damicornis]|uniref:RUN and FYVE domain-containing protein 2-like n=1 Tax=Pocillopora damicornis TaxID=46731 RepID=UPI000F54DDB0|nr:RUN and FYVE domain-containing protein 2-like [Pocillopora damicornis]